MVKKKSAKLNNAKLEIYIEHSKNLMNLATTAQQLLISRSNLKKALGEVELEIENIALQSIKSSSVIQELISTCTENCDEVIGVNPTTGELLFEVK